MVDNGSILVTGLPVNSGAVERTVTSLFDPAVLSYEDLLEKWFFKLHDPTTLNPQGYDVGTQYRSAIFPQTPEQKSAAELVRALRFGVKETKWTMLVMRNLCQIQRDTFHESSMPSWTLGNDWRL